MNIAIKCGFIIVLTITYDKVIFTVISLWNRDCHFTILLRTSKYPQYTQKEHGRS